MSKTIRVLEALETAGESGLHSFDAIKYGGLRAAARINDLRRSGIQIRSIPEKMGDSWGCRYFLEEEV